MNGSQSANNSYTYFQTLVLLVIVTDVRFDCNNKVFVQTAWQRMFRSTVLKPRGS